MAVGDVKSVIASVALSSSVDVRPAVGEEWMILAWGSSSANADQELHVTNGVLSDAVISKLSATGMPLGLRLPITNSLWVRLANTNAVAATTMFAVAIQTK